jgi:hypothetical protein
MKGIAGQTIALVEEIELPVARPVDARLIAQGVFLIAIAFLAMPVARVSSMAGNASLGSAEEGRVLKKPAFMARYHEA